MNSARQMVALVPADISMRRVVVLDWHDGPVEGFVEVRGVPGVWHFRMVGQRIRDDLPDDRLYLFTECPADAFDQLAEVIEDARDEGPFSVPAWTFSDEPARLRAEKTLALLLAGRGPRGVFVRSVDLGIVTETWLSTSRDHTPT